MEALEYLKERERMTNNCEINCNDCKFNYDNNGKKWSCVDYERIYPEQAVQIVEDWTKENPIMTNKDKYSEVIKEIFNVKDNDIVCANMRVPHALCHNFADCHKCAEFWNSEYIPVNK